jgi:hypothetical protein
LLLLLSLLARPLWAQADDQAGVGNCDAPNRRITELDALYQAAEQERRASASRTPTSRQRLQQTDAFAALSRQIEQQSTLLRRLAEQLEPDAKAPEAAAGQDLIALRWWMKTRACGSNSMPPIAGWHC